MNHIRYFIRQQATNGLQLKYPPSLVSIQPFQRSRFYSETSVKEPKVEKDEPEMVVAEDPGWHKVFNSKWPMEAYITLRTMQCTFGLENLKGLLCSLFILYKKTV